MPLVQLYYDEEKIPQKYVRGLVELLAKTVSEQLSIYNDITCIAEQDVKIFTARISTECLNAPEVTVSIFAHPYHGRKEHVETIKQVLSDNVKWYLDKHRIYDVSQMIHITFAEIETAFIPQ